MAADASSRLESVFHDLGLKGYLEAIKLGEKTTEKTLKASKSSGRMAWTEMPSENHQLSSVAFSSIKKRPFETSDDEPSSLKFGKMPSDYHGLSNAKASPVKKRPRQDSDNESPSLKSSRTSHTNKRFHEDSEDEPFLKSDKVMKSEDDADDYEDSEDSCHEKEELIKPRVMQEQIESFRKFVEERGKLSTSLSRMKGLYDEWFAHTQKDSSGPLDQEVFLKSFKRYVSASLKPANMSMESCFRNVNDYLTRPVSVLMHPDYPTKPPSLIKYYCKKYGHTTGFGKMKEVTDRIKEDHVGRQECERELCELEKDFLKKMEEFLSNNHDTLLPKQTEFVRRKINLLRKKVSPQDRAPKIKRQNKVKRFPSDAGKNSL
ncbi:hypothetical protein KIN20_000990 [Parelaphostrongylus tenuis]|uniref:Uncharacterized protein n=1 Tax=Parelaphostrongylus tenuis TaxID=148309 RepID=A0AAD5LWA5_PARTN|nr:hypothetical protein KIN20_000990 [Parelaphostrongylus tenuis]